MLFRSVESHWVILQILKHGVGWALIPFDPETDQIGETVSRIITALQEART